MCVRVCVRVFVCVCVCVCVCQALQCEMKLWGVMDNVMYGDILLVYWGCLLVVLPLVLLWIEKYQPCENRRVPSPKQVPWPLCVPLCASLSLCVCGRARVCFLSLCVCVSSLSLSVPSLCVSLLLRVCLRLSVLSVKRI